MRLDAIRVILLDVEGTTTPLSFVRDVLFPYARLRMGDFLHGHAADAGVHGDLAGLRIQHAGDTSAGHNPPPWDEGGLESVAAYARWLMDRDRKDSSLKSLQGRIWQDGYLTGALVGQVYADVPAAFERWQRAGKTIAIFSSGSVLAQKLLFRHSEAGDLEHFLSAHFDTAIGAKRDSRSYDRIAEALGRQPADVLFLSDSVPELDAARGSGMATALSARESPPPSASHPMLPDFALLG
jgi:enolase-phosphatase E1